MKYEEAEKKVNELLKENKLYSLAELMVKVDPTEGISLKPFTITELNKKTRTKRDKLYSLFEKTGKKCGGQSIFTHPQQHDYNKKHNPYIIDKDHPFCQAMTLFVQDTLLTEIIRNLPLLTMDKCPEATQTVLKELKKIRTEFRSADHFAAGSGSNGQ